MEDLAKATDLKVPWWYYKGEEGKEVPLSHQQNAKLELGYADNQITGGQPKTELTINLDKSSFKAKYDQATKNKAKLEPLATEKGGKAVEVYRKIDKIEDHAEHLAMTASP